MAKHKSMSREAVKKRKQRAARKAKLAAPAAPPAPIELAPDAPTDSSAAIPVHATVPVTADDSPDKFTHVPDPAPVADGAAPDDPTAPESSDVPRTDVPKPDTTPGEAALFGKLVVGYFQIGTASLFKKDPRTQQAFIGLAASLPEFQGPSGPVKLSPDQAYAALCGFIGGAAERVALKYNLRIPYVDELTVAGAIGIATYGLIPKKKPKGTTDTTAAAQAKNANPAPNGKSTNPEAHAEADAAAQAPPGVPIETSAAPDLDEMV